MLTKQNISVSNFQKTKKLQDFIFLLHPEKNLYNLQAKSIMAKYFDATHIEFATDLEVSDQKSNNKLEFKFENISNKFDVAQYNTINMEFSTDVDVKQPKLNDNGSFYMIYSPQKIKLIPENSNWISSKTKDEIIQLGILNKNFYNTINIRKNQEMAYIFLINQ